MLDKEFIRNQTKEYFAAFEKRDLKKIERFFDRSISLLDSTVDQVFGYDNVIGVYQGIFDDCKTIHFTKMRIFVDITTNTAVGELEIDIDGKLIRVADIIEFNDLGKIHRITAYLDTGG